jgi:moderate conductance mechanosensitive channel
LRVLVIRALARAGIVTAADAKVGVVEGPGAEQAAAEQEEYEKTREPVER